MSKFIRNIFDIINPIRNRTIYGPGVSISGKSYTPKYLNPNLHKKYEHIIIAIDIMNHMILVKSIVNWIYIKLPAAILIYD